MAKVLKVKDPFLRLDFGDTFEMTEDGKGYISNVKEDFKDVRDDGSEYSTQYNASFTISKDYADQMIKDGYLEPVEEKAAATPFVNVFNEIDNLLQQYSGELSNIDNGDPVPECLKVEKKAVLTNIVTVLQHLKKLKKN